MDDIINHDTAKYNSNNHWTDNKIPDDYHNKLSKNNTSKWIHLFKNDYKQIVIESKDITWMKKAYFIGSQTGKFSNLYSDELEQTVDELNVKYNKIFDGTKYFVRTDNVSLKYGMHCMGPYYDIKSIIKSIVTCPRGHSPIYEDTKTINIYLIPWINIEDKNEFRVFVHKNKISAISQQNLYKKLYDNIDFKKLNTIVNYFDSDIKNKITWMDSYTYDFALIVEDNDSLKPYFIEPNSFGKEYAAGSALFHWLIDEDKLYGNGINKNIYFRFTI